MLGGVRHVYEYLFISHCNIVWWCIFFAYQWSVGRVCVIVSIMCDGLLDKKIKRMNRLFFFVERIFFFSLRYMQFTGVSN